MTYRKSPRLVLLSVVALLLLLAAVGTISALPGSSKSASTSALSAEQRQLIDVLHDSYRSAIAGLDWSIADEGHDPATLDRARELQSALRQSIFEVIHRDFEAAPSSGPERCPYSDKAVPVGGSHEGPTLFL